MVTLWGGRELDLYAHPVLGNRDARYVVAKLFDYTCPGCRKLHTSLERASKRYGDQLVIVMLPTPLSTDCNKHVKQQRSEHVDACKYARLAQAVSQQKPEAFAEFHDWLIRDTQVPSLQAAANKAISILGSKEAVHEALRDPRIDELIQQNVNLYGQLDKNELPTMFFLKKRITGVPTPKQLLDLLEKYFLILPVE